MMIMMMVIKIIFCCCKLDYNCIIKSINKWEEIQRERDIYNFKCRNESLSERIKCYSWN